MLLCSETKAGDGARTRDIKLGRLALYQLSYSRVYRLHQHGALCFNNLAGGGGCKQAVDPNLQPARLPVFELTPTPAAAIPTAVADDDGHTNHS